MLVFFMAEVMKLIGLLLVFLSLLSLSTAQSPKIISNTTTCPIDLSYVLRLPFNSSSCKNFQAPPKTPQMDTTQIPCCQTLLSLFGIGTAQHLNATTFFQLPNIAASNSCLQNFQSKLTSLALPPNLVSYCFDPSQFVTSPNLCAQIESSQDWVSKLNQTTVLDFACKPDLTDLSSCDACVAAGFKIQQQLIAIDGNSSHSGDCWYFTILYAAGMINSFGPESQGAMSCIFSLSLDVALVGLRKKSYTALVTAVVSATGGLLTVLFLYFLWKKSLGKKRAYSENIRNVSAGGGKNDIELPVLSLRSILAATNNFSEANKLGEGGFGPVYKGILNENLEVAIKRLSKKSGQGYQEFMNELKLIAKLQHNNLVRLLGCCIEKEEMILIYEYMPNRSLDKFLFDPRENTKLDWGKRFHIIEAMNPKISDFGMAKIFEINQTEANTNRVVGTYGYMSPEYARYGHFSEKLDVFSFGVLLLEIVSGRRNFAFYHLEHPLTLAGWVWKLWNEGRGLEVIDASVRETCLPHEALRCIHVALLCVQEDPVDRPTMSSVVHMLANEATSLPLFKEPAFSTHSNYKAICSSSPSSSIFSNNLVTISVPEGR
ncbi:probable receptor-like protein kinase At1g11050 isoform X2 [Rosa rugosa]|uniref:probable receptor-like protein kinase At1g11050 isoform X2 n=1 Tax=Rosa rugosa TaxID=74645 RepID=UPI002B404842|nr:probable receptor-like protein kinase At1g11050 isoform X2 [Rosa rugosa]